MSKPEVKRLGGIYTLAWKEEGVFARVDHIAEHSGVLSGEVLLQTVLPGQNGHLHQARLNLTSTTARNAVIKALQSRADDLDWYAIIEQLCREVINLQREGEPFQVLPEIASAPTVTYRAKPLLVEGQANVIYGPGEFGKSYLGQYLAALVASGYTQPFLEIDPGHVLYLDYETSAADFKMRMEGIYRGLEQEPGGELLYRYCVQGLADDLAAIQKVVFEHGIKLVIIDSAALAAGSYREGDPSGPTIRYFQALRELRCTTLTIAHVAKAAKSSSIYGSVFWFNMARNVWEVKKVQEPEEAGFTIGLYHRKANSVRRFRPFSLQFHIDAKGTLLVSAKDVGAVPEFQEAGIKTALLAALQFGAKTVNELSETVGAGESAVRGTLNRGAGTSFVRIVSAGGGATTWGLRSGR